MFNQVYNDEDLSKMSVPDLLEIFQLVSMYNKHLKPCKQD